ncbi:unnamed protein product [Arabis nemorensis]|uniref:SGNH hydrolase-type esterase domain-containing protein n=1 Tax=Arabis nemorensis TaxID=586526 RepID=A0A565ATD4_9BRAS|nr:unnamed protein product [Arabis nemorensis]
MHTLTSKISKNSRASPEFLRLPYVPPYYGSQNGSFEKGVNFAVAGATALEHAFLKSKGIHYAYKLQGEFAKSMWFSCREMIGNALIIVGVIGGNDYNYASFVGKGIEETKELVPLVISTISSTITVNIFSWKLQFLDYYDPLTRYLKWLNEFRQHHNKELQAEFNRLQKLYPHVAILYADYYNAALQIFQEPAKFGFINRPLSACCGSGGMYIYNSVSPCGTKGVDCCLDPSKYVHWDGNHLTEYVYRRIAVGLLEGPYTVPAFDWSCLGFELENRSLDGQYAFSSR